MSTKKFGSPNLDTPSSRYDFPKFALNSRKRIKENLNYSRWHVGPGGQLTPHVSQRETGDEVDRRFLTDGEVSGKTVFTIVLPVSIHVEWWC
jgi:hypothetical protein